FYEADRGPRLAAQPENRPRRNQVAPVCVPYCSRGMVEIRPAETDDELERFLAVTARIAPEDRITVAELRLIEQRIETVHLLAVENAEPVGTARVGRTPYAPNRKAAFANVTVPSEHCRRGVGTKLYSAVSDWARARQFDSLEGHLRDDDPDSLLWAQHRGFVE